MVVMIGRERERRILEECLYSGRPELLVVFGRYGVGKTWLVRGYFEHFAFYSTGVADTGMKGQLRIFYESLLAHGLAPSRVPEDWFEAFRLLRELLEQPEVYREPTSGRRVVFLDELPWMDTPRSEFRGALDWFWNSWGSTCQDLLLIVCGSATSWIIDHLLGTTGGLHNRITRQIQLQPFTLRECELLYQSCGISMTRRQVIESYMIGLAHNAHSGCVISEITGDDLFLPLR